MLNDGLALARAFFPVGNASLNVMDKRPFPAKAV
jgi:hypothetical protein